MALQTQNIPYVFEKGVDTKTNSFTTTGLLVLENAVFDTPKKLKKRNGYRKLGTACLNSDTEVTDPDYLNVFDNELIAYQDGRVYGYSQANDAWIDKGEIVSAIASKSQVIKNSYEQTSPDVGYLSGISVYSWSDTRGGVRIAVFDQTTGSALVSDTEIDATGEAAKVIVCGRYFFVYFVDGSDLKVVRIDPLNPTTIGSASTVVSDIDGVLYDVTVCGSSMLVTYLDTAGDANLFYYLQSLQQGTLTNGFPAILTTDQDPTDTLGVTYNSNDAKIYVYSFNTTTGLEVTRYNTDFTVSTAKEVIDSSVSPVVISATALPTTTGVTVFYTVNDADDSNVYVNKATVPTSGSPGASSVLKRSVGLVSKSFSVNDVGYVLTVHDSPLQATYFLLRDDGLIAGKYLANVAGGLPSTSILQESVMLSSTEVMFSLLEKGRLLTQDSTVFTQTGVDSVIVNFGADNNYQSAQLGKNLHIVGGFLQNYDGFSVTEHGFHLFPEGIAVNSTPTTGGNIANGTYSYKAVYEWTDAQGQRHISAPSEALSVTLSGGTGTQRVVLDIPTLRLTSKSGTRTNVTISVYRTQTLGSIYYRVSSITSPTYNDTTVNTVSFNDTLADGSIASNEVLYTTGDVVENIAPPVCKSIVSLGNRLFLIDLDNGTIWFSKPFTPGYGVEFSDLFTKTVDSEGGLPQALGVLDNKLIIFKESLLFAMAGDGPNNTGSQDTFTIPERITSDVGCDTQISIVTVPDGIMFKSSKGIYQLNRSLQTGYIGAAVDSFNSLSVTGATLLNDLNQVRFVTSDGECLVYDYLIGQWSVFTPHKAKSAVNWNGNYVYLNTDGRVLLETRGVYVDDANPIKLKIRTGWFSFAGLQGFSRIYQILLLGEYKGAHTLRVKIAYNFAPYFSQTVLFNSATNFDPDYYGTDSYYGESATYSGSELPYQYEIRNDRQKVQSICFEIDDVIADNANEAYTITGLTFEVGLKKGTMKLASTKVRG